MYSHCPTCQGITVESLSQPSGHQHLTLGALRRSSKQCRVCCLLCSALKESPLCSRGLPDKDVIWQDSWSLTMHLTRGVRPRVELRAQNHEGCRLWSEILVHTNENDPSTHFGLCRLLSLPENTMSETSFATARSWLADCVSGHGQASHVAETDMEFQYRKHRDQPRRLVHVQRCHSGLMLKLTDSSSVARAYTALSHCWGAGPWPWITSKANLRQRQIGFTDAAMPPTIRDACFVALELNISYIWIDCLCIVQDDINEWTLEAPKMGVIFNSSVVTISATYSNSGGSGLFNTKSSGIWERTSAPNIAVESTLSCGTKSTLYLGSHHLVTSSLAAWRTLIKEAPLLQRAWVAQERVSSRRIIHYTATQMFWECEHCIASEDNALLTSDQHWVAGARLLFAELYRSSSLDGLHMSIDEILTIWYIRFVARVYSRCNLTFGRDKLVAISGLANLIHEKTNLAYYAGHWAHTGPRFIDSLRWARDSAGTKACEYRAPSWSWASQDTSIMFFGPRSDTDINHLSRIVDLVVEPALPATSPFGLLASGEMTIEGPLLRCELKYIPYTSTDEVCIDATGAHADYHFLDDGIAPLRGAIAYALALKCEDTDSIVQYLLLHPTGSDPQVMKRIGIGLTHHNLDWAQRLLRAPKTIIRIV